MTHLSKLFFITLSSFIFIGCSQEAEYASDTSLYTPNVTGQFIDAAVQGLDYSCTSGTIGVTDMDGNYTCEMGDDVTFTLGSITIGTIAAQEGILTPYIFFPNDVDSAINLARLLQSMDEDGDNSNEVIVLDADLISLVPSDTDFESSTFEAYMEDNIETNLVSYEDAINNLNESVIALGGEIPDGGNIPVANAGLDQNASNNVLVSLDGSLSADADSNDTLTYLWSVKLLPQDSNITISDVTSITPTFTPDVNGTYVFGLVINDGKINSASDSVRIISTNAAPITTFTSFSMNEDSNYTNELNATDINGDTLTYSIVSDASSGNLTMESNGTFTYIPNADYNGTDSFSYKVNDTQIDSLTQTVDINISAVNDIPLITSGSSFSVNENQLSGFTPVASDIDGDILVYSLTGTDEGSFNINSSSGVVTFKVSPDYEAKSTYSVTLNVNDSNLTATQDVIVNILDVAEVPIIDAMTGNIDENSVAGTSVGTINISYAGDSAITAITLTGTGSDDFESSTAGAVTVKAGAVVDFETISTYVLTAVATSGSGDSNTVNLSITLNNVAETAPTLIDTALAIAENATSSDLVGNLTIADIGDTNITSIALTGIGNGNFDITTDGIITVSSSASLDYETTTSYTLTATATNDFGVSNSVTVTVHVNDVIDTVAILANFTAAIDENSVATTAVGSITISDAGDSAITSMILSGTGSDNFTVDALGAITVATSPTLDFEVTPLFSLKAIATNGAGDSSEVDVAISLNNLAEIATLANSTGSIIENAETGDSVGLVTISDAGDSAITVIALSGIGNENFEVNASGSIILAAGSALDYETTTSYSLTAIATNTAGDSASVDVDITIIDYAFNPLHIATISASDAESEDYFGSSVSVSGDYIVVGANGEDPDGIVTAGSAYLFKKNSDSTVTQIAKIQASDYQTYDYFGTSVSISGDYIVVGSYMGDAPAENQGKVYLYKRNSDTTNDVSQLATIIATDAEAYDYLGYSVSISGDYIVAGAYNEDPAATTDAGSAYIFKRNSDVVDDYTQIAKISADTPTDNSAFGYSVSIDGDYIVVGAYKEDTGATDSGSAYLFKRNSDVSVTQIAKIQASTPTAGSFFGNSVSISGNNIAVGAYQETTTDFYAGSTYVFERNSDTANDVTQISKIVASDVEASAYFGSSVSVSGNYMLVGAKQEDILIGDAGAVYSYEINTTASTVTLVSKIVASDAAMGDLYGNSVAISGNNIAIGAFNEDTPTSNAGSVYVYDAEPLGVAP